MQGFDVASKSDIVETDLGVAPLHPRPVTVEDEVIVDALLAQPMLEIYISRLKSIYGATKYVSFNAMNVRLEIRKKVDTTAAPKLLIDIFNKLHPRLSITNIDSINWLLHSRSQPWTKPELVLVSNGNIRIYHGFRGYGLSKGQTNNQAW